MGVYKLTFTGVTLKTTQEVLHFVWAYINLHLRVYR